MQGKHLKMQFVRSADGLVSVGGRREWLVATRCCAPNAASIHVRLHNRKQGMFLTPLLPHPVPPPHTPHQQVVDKVRLYCQVPRDECTAYNLRRRAPGAPATGSTPAATSAAGDGGDEAGKGARKGKSKAHRAARKAMHAVAVVDVPEADGGVRDDGEHSDDGSNDRRRQA